MTAVAAHLLPEPITAGIPAAVRRVIVTAAALVLPAMVASWSLAGPEAAIGAAVGGGIAGVNFWLLARLVVQATAAQDLGVGALLARLVTKFGVLGLCLALAVFALQVEPLGLLLGLSTIFAGVLVHTAAEQVASRGRSGHGADRR